jgi:hypothetical protein
MRSSKPSYYKELHNSKINNEGRTFVQLDQILQGMIWFLHHTEPTDENSAEHNESGTLWEEEMIERKKKKDIIRSDQRSWGWRRGCGCPRNIAYRTLFA